MEEFLAKADTHFTIEKDFCPVFDEIIESQVKPVFEAKLGKKIDVIDDLQSEHQIPKLLRLTFK